MVQARTSRWVERSEPLMALTRAHTWLALGCMVAAGACGCTATLDDLQGDRTAVLKIGGPDGAAGTPASGGVTEYPVTFDLRNSSWGKVRVESVRVPISTVVMAQPELPVSLKPGETLRLTVVTKVLPNTPVKARTVLLETKGQEPLKLVVQPAG